MAWQMLANLTEVEQYLAEAEASCQGKGVESVAAHIAKTLSESTAAAFEGKRDPRTHRAWAGPAEATIRSRGFKGLLERSGELRAAVQSGYEIVPVGARVKVSIEGSSDIVRRGMVHMYGVKARARRSNRATRKRPGQAMPARRFVGMWGEDVKTTIKMVETSLFPETT